MAILFVIVTTRPGDSKPTPWYFDDPVEYNKAVNMLQSNAARFVACEDFATDAEEFRLWWLREY
jgi:hypothetical protein